MALFNGSLVDCCSKQNYELKTTYVHVEPKCLRCQCLYVGSRVASVILLLLLLI